MSVDVSLLLLAKAAAPPVALLAIGLAWLSWKRTFKAIPATLFSLGMALLALIFVVVVEYGSADSPAFTGSMISISAVVLSVYVATLVALVRSADISIPKATICGLIGLVPLYFAGGFVLIHAACSLGTGGC